MGQARNTADAAAAEVFANSTVDEVRTVFVSTFVQVGRFTDSEARDMRRWATAAMVAQVGVEATVDFVVSCGPEAVAEFVTA